MAIDYRTESFLLRFTNALPHLNAGKIQDIVSFKYRDTVSSYSEYLHFIDDHLKGDLLLDIKELDGDFRGRAWLVKDKSGNKTILVEHETGLEILGAIGSIASLIALIPLISSGWARFRGRLSHRHFRDPDGDVETRRFDKNNVLIQQQTSSVEIHVLNIIQQENSLLSQKVQSLENEIEKLKKKSLPKRKKPTPKSKRKTKKK